MTENRKKCVCTKIKGSVVGILANGKQIRVLPEVDGQSPHLRRLPQRNTNTQYVYIHVNVPKIYDIKNAKYKIQNTKNQGPT